MFASIARRLLLVFVLGGGIAVFLYVVQPDKRGRTPEGAGVGDEGGEEDISVEGVRHFEFDGGTLRWSIQAKTARFFQAGNLIRFDTVTAVFHPPEGGTMQLSALRGYYDTATGNIGVEGDVTGRSDDGYEFRTHRVTYEAATRSIHGQDKVTLRKDRVTIEGVGLEGSLERRSIRVLSSVKAAVSQP